MTILLHLEEAALSAWPALQTIYYDGWLVRFSGGYTKRANSVNALYGSTLPIEEKITCCEGLYKAKGLLPVFRMTPVSTPGNLDDCLAGRGYTVIDTTLVQSCNLKKIRTQYDSQVPLSPLSIDPWFKAFCQLSRVDINQADLHYSILKTIPSTCLFASLVHKNQIIACGLGVLEKSYLGLFDLITDPDHRGQGFGTTLVSGMLQWGEMSGATRAYLQVMKTNTLARRVYEKMGFQTEYTYWYRIPVLTP